MNQQQSYLKCLEDALKDVSAETRVDLLDEIASHIEEMQQHELQRSIDEEMGSATTLSERLLLQIRPKRIPDFLWALLPMLLLEVPLQVVTSRLLPPLQNVYASMGIRIVISLLLYLFARRRSAELRLFWGIAAITTLLSALIFVTLINPSAGYQSWQPPAWAAWLAGIALLPVAWDFAKFVLRIRDDLLLSSFVAVALLTAALTPVATSLVYGRIPTYEFGEWAFALSALASLIGSGIAIALFFLPEQRIQRWMGVLLQASLPLASVFVLTQSTPYPFYEHLGSYLILVEPILFVLFCMHREKTRLSRLQTD